MRPRYVIAIIVAVIGIASGFFVKLAILAMMAAISSYLSLPIGSERPLRVARWALLIAAPFIVVGLFRFTIDEAMPGIIEGSRRGLTTRAVAALREIRFTEDLLREQAYWDPDGDGIGSAGLIEEFTRRTKLRGQKQAPEGLVQRFRQFEEGSEGVFAIQGGYAYIVFLPTRDGQGIAKLSDAIDDERAERRYVAYAWPTRIDHGENPILFLDEHERIWRSDNKAQRYLGKDKMPHFDAALPSPSIDKAHPDTPADGEFVIGQDGQKWTPWKGKHARPGLPGDKR